MKQISLADAIGDLQVRTLSTITGHLARLVYLASTRDYLTGRYYHDGLALRFKEEVAEMALSYCHHDVFERILRLPMEEFSQEIDSYIGSASSDPQKIVESWSSLHPYRVLVPSESDLMSQEFFFSNVKISLAILEYRLKQQVR